MQVTKQNLQRNIPPFVLFLATAALLAVSLDPLPAHAQTHTPATGWASHPTAPPVTFPTSASSYCNSGHPVYAERQLQTVGNDLAPYDPGNPSDAETPSAAFATALATCTSGTLEIAPSGNNYSIVVTPFTLPEGVTLQIDAGVVMFASLNPNDYRQNNITYARLTTTLTTVIGSITVNAGGSSCSTGGTAVTVNITGGTFTTQATATAVVSGSPLSVQSITMVNNGAGYSSSAPPTITVQGCSAHQPSTTIVYGTGVGSVSPVSGSEGAGYAAPVVEIMPPTATGGVQAIAAATLNKTSGGDVATVTVPRGGSGTCTATGSFPVTFPGTYTTPATATALVANLAVQSITMLSHGAGYTATPTATIDASAGCSVPTTTVALGYPLSTGANFITNAGTGYTVAPTAWIENTCGLNDLPNESGSGTGCVPFITIAPNEDNAANGSAIIGFGTIDGRGSQPLRNSSNPRIIGGTGNPTSQMMPDTSCFLNTNEYSWYCLAQNVYYQTPNGHQNNPHLIYSQQASNFGLYGITLQNSPEFFVRWEGLDATASVTVPRTGGLTIFDTKIYAPFTARNTDGIDPVENIWDVYINNTYISNGDDNIAVSSNGINSGGPSGDPGVKDITIDTVYAYNGLGMAVGSPTAGGVAQVLFQNLRLAGSPNGAPPNTSPAKQAGLKIKSSVVNGGVVDDVTYNNVCMMNQAQPIMINANWVTNWGNGDNTNPPTFKNIVLENITVLKDDYDTNTGSFQFSGLDTTPYTKAGVTWNNISVYGTPATPTAQYLQIYNDEDNDQSPPQSLTVPASFQTLANGNDIPTYINTGSPLPNDAPVCNNDVTTFPSYAVDLFISTGSNPTGINTNMINAPNPGASIHPGNVFNLNVVVTPTRGQDATQPTPTSITVQLHDTVHNTYTSLGNPTLVPNSNGTLYTFPVTAGSAATYTYQAWVKDQKTGSNEQMTSNFVTATVN